MKAVYRDAWLLVIDKPAGLPTQSTRAGEDGVYELLKAQEEVVYLHHRLDRPASGLVLFALHKDANKGITDGLREHRIERGYRAMLYGRAQSGEWTGKVDGKSATTRVVLEATGAGMSAVRIELVTGRKHQIRVQSALAGVPVVGDRRYGGDAARAWPRLALHAASLKLPHPVTGEPLELEAPIPEDLAPLWARMRS